MMTAAEMGRKGGQATSPAKRRAAAKNLAKARRILKETRRQIVLDKTRSAS